MLHPIRYVSLALVKWIDRHPDRPLVVLSGNDGEGRSTVSGNLAVAIAETGQTVHLAAPAETQDELRRILYAAQLRIPPRARTRPLPGAAPGTRVNGSSVGSPGAVRLPQGGAYPSPAAVAKAGGDPDATLVMTVPEKTRTEPPVVLAEPVGVLIGGGEVRLIDLGAEPHEGVVVIDAPPSDIDERGVRAAQDGAAVLVVARDRTRNNELSRLVGRLRSAGAQTLGFVLTGVGRV